MASHQIMISVDPGLDACGVASWKDGRLMRAEYVRAVVSERDLGDGDTMQSWERSAWATWVACGRNRVIDELVLERPQVYARRLNTDPADLIALALLDGAIAGLFRAAAGYSGIKVTTYLPSEHKGQIKKPKGARDANDYIIRNRALARLTDEEQLGIVGCAPGLMHNVWDAIWIGLHHLGRGTNTKTKEI